MSTRMLTSIQLSISLLTCTQIQRQTQSYLAVYMYMLYKILFSSMSRVAPVIRITKQPRSRVLCMNERFRFVCEATCSSGDYKWFRGSKEIPGTSWKSMYYIQLASSDNYSCVSISHLCWSSYVFVCPCVREML